MSKETKLYVIQSLNDGLYMTSNGQGWTNKPEDADQMDKSLAEGICRELDCPNILQVIPVP